MEIRGSQHSRPRRLRSCPLLLFKSIKIHTLSEIKNFAPPCGGVYAYPPEDASQAFSTGCLLSVSVFIPAYFEPEMLTL